MKKTYIDPDGGVYSEKEFEELELRWGKIDLTDWTVKNMTDDQINDHINYVFKDEIEYLRGFQ